MKTISICLIMALAFLATGCIDFMVPVEPPGGGLFSAYTAPLMTHYDKVPADGRKVSSSTYYLHEYIFTGIELAWGEAEIQKLAKQKGLTEVYYADYEWTQFLGLFGEFKVNVYGR